MNRPEHPRVDTQAANRVALPCLADLAFALLASDCTAVQGAEAAWLEARGRLAEDCARSLAPGVEGREAVVQSLMSAWLADPPPKDHSLYALAAREALSLPETLAVALASAAELVPMAARALIWLQHPVGGARPTAGLMASLCERLGEVHDIDDIVLAKIPAGYTFAFGMINASATFGASATVAIGVSGTTGKYRAAATHTATVPTLFGLYTAADDVPLAAAETVLLTVGVAALPSSGSAVVDLYFSAP